MVFNSVVFLFCFLPLSLLLYYLAPGRVKNLILLAESLVFYCWTGTAFLPLILCLILFNYLWGLLTAAARGKLRAFLPAVAALGNLGVLVYFKYANFLIDTINQIGSFGIAELSVGDVLPLGISYYIFKIISYEIDVYTGRITSEKNLITFSCYVLFFPQLIVGPIVPYRVMAAQFHKTAGRCSLPLMERGVELFVFGLAKKVLLADSIGALWTDIIGSGGVGLANVSTPLAWLGILAYSLQLYFDFAGYSEMSNGLAALLGFDCPANFDLPYISGSITEFWRRWHISLSTWFRDYIYIPLGGNRKGKARQLFNMLIVWAATGIWLGALLFRAAHTGETVPAETSEKRAGMAAPVYAGPGRSWLGDLYCQPARCTAGLADAETVSGTGRHLPALLSAQLRRTAGARLPVCFGAAAPAVAEDQPLPPAESPVVPASGSTVHRLRSRRHQHNGAVRQFLMWKGGQTGS